MIFYFTGVGLVMVLVIGLMLCPILIPVRLLALAVEVAQSREPGPTVHPEKESRK